MNEFASQNRESYKVSPELSPDISEVKQHLRDALPSMATDLIRASQDMSLPANQSFAAQPDNRLEHTPRWHQYGILSHSYEFENVLQTVVPKYLEQWGLAEQVEAALSKEIDGIPKNQLLQIAALVHDLGKFTTRNLAYNKDTGVTNAHFRDHEKHSGSIIRDKLKPLFKEWGLTDLQIEYVANCAELHFELGKVRQASTAGGGYTIAFTKSPAFISAAQNILDEHPDYALEIGLQFIADSLSKTEVAATSETDEGIAAERPALTANLAAKGLNPSLIDQALQQPVNVKVAQGYLQQWAAQFN